MVRVGPNRQVLEVGRSFVSALMLDGMAIKVKAAATSPGRVRFDVGARPSRHRIPRAGAQRQSGFETIGEGLRIVSDHQERGVEGACFTVKQG